MKAAQGGSHATQTFLKQENRELRQQVEELRQLLEHNKNALRASINYSKDPSAEDQKPYQKLINHLYRENDYLKKQLQLRQGERSEANSQVPRLVIQILFSQKLVEASQDYERELVDDLKDKITALKLDIKKKEERIDQLERQKPQFDSNNMLHVKIMEVTSPDTISIRFHDEAEMLKQMLVAKQQEILKEKENREELYRLNLALTKQINELKSYGYDRSTQSKDLPSNSPHQDMGKYMEYQRKMFDEDQSLSEESMSSDEPPEHLLENLEPADIKPKGKPVPKLELRKAKEIQEIIVKKINLDEKKKHKTHNQGGARHEQLVVLKKRLNSEVLQNLSLSRTVDQLKRFTKTLEQQNQLLLKKMSNVKISERSELNISQEYRPMLERTHIQDLLNVGRDIYLNENLQEIIEGNVEPHRLVKGRSNSFSL